MKKKEKIRKKSDDEIRIIECIKDYLNKYSAKSNLIRNIDFREQTNDGFLRFIASIDYGAFEQRIVYYPNMLLKEHFVDVEFSIGKTDYVYTFYDIFNLFDIDDFNLYFYSDFLCEDDAEKALTEILSATEKYYGDIKRAGTDAYLPQLEKNYETDMNRSTDGEDWKLEKEEDDFFLLPFNHPYYSVSDGEKSEKTLKMLQKRNSKDKLTTIYEKRLLNYLERGNELGQKMYSDQKEFGKIYKKAKRKINLLLFAVSMVISLLLVFGVHALMFNGAVTFGVQWEIFGVVSELPINRIAYGIGCAFLLTLALIPFFGKKLVARFVPEDQKNRAGAKFEKEFVENSGSKKFNTAVEIFTGAFLLVMFGIVVLLSASDIGYYDTSVKFMDDSLRFCSMPYEEIEIYKLQGYYNDDEFIPYENAYAIFGEDKYYDYGEILPNGMTQQKLEEIAEKYDKEIKEIKSIEDLYENSGN